MLLARLFVTSCQAGGLQCVFLRLPIWRRLGPHMRKSICMRLLAPAPLWYKGCCRNRPLIGMTHTTLAGNQPSSLCQLAWCCQHSVGGLHIGNPWGEGFGLWRPVSQASKRVKHSCRSNAVYKHIPLELPRAADGGCTLLFAPVA